MSYTGKGRIPVLLILVMCGLTFAGDVILYTLPSQQRPPGHPEHYRHRFPKHGIVDLSDNWQILSDRADTARGTIDLPIAYEGRKPLVLRRIVALNARATSIHRLRLQPLGGQYRIFLNGTPLPVHLLPYAENVLVLPNPLLRQGNNRLEIQFLPYSAIRSTMPAWLPINLPRLNSGLMGVVLETIGPHQILEADYRGFFPDSQQFVYTGTLRFAALSRFPREVRLTLRLWEGDRLLKERRFRLAPPVPELFRLPEDTIPAPPPWQPQHPRSYWIETLLDTGNTPLERVRTPIAVRHFRVSPSGFELNFRETVIRGLNYVYQSREGSQLFDAQQVRTDLLWIKNQGFNAVRLPLHPLPETFFQICDELGLLCFVDLPLVYPSNAFSSLAVGDTAWSAYYRYAQSLAQRYNAVVGIGLSFFLDASSRAAGQWVQRFVKSLPPSRLPLYLNTSMPMAQPPEGIDFLIVELLERNQIPLQLADLESRQVSGPQLPSGYSKSFSYRVDSTTVIHDLLQMANLLYRVRKSLGEGKLPGHFAPVYSDFYLQFPSLQNGFQQDFYLNRIGMVTLSRSPRQMLAGNLRSGLTDAGGLSLVISEARGAHSYLYILVGLVNFFLFLIAYRRFINFRHNINYAFRKPHGFFVNLQERILIPRAQTLFLMLILSVNGAIILGSIMFFFRNNLLADYLLSVVFFHPELKSWIADLIWNQGLFLLVGTAWLAAVFFLLAIPIKLLGLRRRHRVKWRQAWSASVWAAVPFLFLVPLGAFVYNLLITMKSYWILIGILVYFHIWYYFRWINGIRVLTDRLYGRLFFAFTVLLLGGMVLVVWLYQHQVRLLDHLTFIYHLYTYYH